MVSTIQLRNLPPKPMKSMIPNISQSVLILTVPLHLSWSSIHRCFPDVCPFAYSSRYFTRNSWKILRMRLDSSQFLDACVWPDFSESWTSGWCKADEPQVRGSRCALNPHNIGDQTSQNRTALETSEYGNSYWLFFLASTVQPLDPWCLPLLLWQLRKQPPINLWNPGYPAYILCQYLDSHCLFLLSCWGRAWSQQVTCSCLHIFIAPVHIPEDSSVWSLFYCSSAGS